MLRLRQRAVSLDNLRVSWRALHRLSVHTLGSAVLALVVCGLPSVGWSIDFDHEVVPVLRKHCAPCHSGSEAKGGFSLNSRDSFLESEAAVPGDASASHFLELVRSDDPELQMPPKDRPRVPDADIKTLARWIDQQMPWTAGFSFAGQTYEPPVLPRHVELPGPEGRHPIDRLLTEYLATRKVGLPPTADDATFIRRASLDLTGLLPTAEMVKQFQADRSEDKRAELIDQLLANDLGYAEHWLTFWNDWLRNDYDGTGFITGGRKQVSRWLYRSLIENKPYDQFARELVSPISDESRGFIDGIKWRGTVSAGQTLEIQFAQSVAQTFLGINLKCASCHDSFIDRWKLSDAYSLAAVYANGPLEVHRCDKPIGKQATAAWLFPEIGQIDPQANRDQRLKQLAGLMISEKNGRFSRTIVNRLWAALMGRGIVHPLDAMQQRPWDEDVLDYLANYLVEQDYDLKQVLRLIATSEAYAANSRVGVAPTDSDSVYTFAGPLAKRMTAEQFLDSVWQITGAAPLKFDAPVVRGAKFTRGEAVESQAEWIWGESAKDGKTPPGGEQLVFRRPLDLPAAVASGVAVVTADNAFEMYVGRRQVVSSNEWSRIQTVPMRGVLKPGENDIVVVARNFLDKPNLAGLFFETHLKLENGETVTLKSDELWEVSSNPPVGGREGRLGRVAGPWTKAVNLGRPGPYNAIYPQVESDLSRGLSGRSEMVRASLLKANFLMRSLGRPNRDQIVTSRPSELTTLEAIDLANGPSLAKALSKGAENLLAKFDSPAEVIDHLFQQALSRMPTASEQATLAAALGPEPTRQAVEDVLWAVVMMPEFVMVR